MPERVVHGGWVPLPFGPVAESTWATREVPILEAINSAEEAGTEDLRAAAAAAVPDVSEVTLMRVLAKLARAGLIEVGSPGGNVIRVLGMTPVGLRQIGAWPSPEAAWERLIQEVERRAETAAEGPERTRWQRLRDSLLGIGRDLGVEVAGSVLTGGVGI